MNTTINKAIVAFLSSAVTVVAIFWPPVSEYVSPEVVGIIGTIATAALTWLVPNKVA